MKKQLLIIAFTIGCIPVNAQFVNGSFETTTGNCDFNISNSSFNSKMSDCYAFGVADQLDIIENSCQYGGAQEGNFLVGLAVAADDIETDAFSLKLATPLVAGSPYQLTFYNKKTNTFDANELQIGYSSDSLSMGTIIDTAATPTTGAWELVTITFTPTTAAEFITIKTIAGTYGWNHVDNFSITAGTSIANAASGTTLLYPNPASNSATITLADPAKVTAITLTDIAGKKQNVGIHKQDGKIMLDLSAVADGMYFLEVRGQENFTQKLLIAR